MFILVRSQSENFTIIDELSTTKMAASIVRDFMGAKYFLLIYRNDRVKYFNSILSV